MRVKPPVLRPYQREALSNIDAACKRGVRSQLLVKPTGSGKTLVFAHIAAECGGRALIVCNRTELIEQAVRKLIEAGISAIDIGIVANDRNELDRRIVVASVQTISRPERLAKLPTDFKVIIVDEAHHAAAPSYGMVLRHLRVGKPGGPLLLGFTATPVRGDGVGLDGVFDEIVHEVSLLDLIGQGYLSDVRALNVRIDRDFTQFANRAGDYDDAETGAALSAARAPETVVRAWQEHAVERSTIIFCSTVKLSDETTAAFIAAGISAATISGETPAKERRLLLDRFRAGELTVLCNAQILTEGIDLPMCSCVVISKPTKSPVAYSQMVGRGLRRHPGKDDCLVVDLVGATLDLELQTVSTLTGLPADALSDKGATVRGVMQRMQAAGETTVKTVDGRIVVIPVNILGSAMNWLPTGTGRYVLNAGERGTFVLVPTGETWTALHVPKGDGSGTTIAEGASLEWAQGVAEDRLRSFGKAVLAERSAPWRSLEPTDKQLKMLRKFGIPKRSVKGKSRGEVADLIGSAVASQNLAGVA